MAQDFAIWLVLLAAIVGLQAAAGYASANALRVLTLSVILAATGFAVFRWYALPGEPGHDDEGWLILSDIVIMGVLVTLVSLSYVVVRLAFRHRYEADEDGTGH